jgi:hypothetical protein
MQVFRAFEVEIRQGTPDTPASVRIALLRYTRDEDVRVCMTPECSSLRKWRGSSIPC